MWLSELFYFEVLLWSPHSHTLITFILAAANISPNSTSIRPNTHLSTVYQTACCTAGSYITRLYNTLTHTHSALNMLQHKCFHGISVILINTKQYWLYFQKKYWYWCSGMGLVYWSQLKRIARSMRSISHGRKNLHFELFFNPLLVVLVISGGAEKWPRMPLASFLVADYYVYLVIESNQYFWQKTRFLVMD